MAWYSFLAYTVRFSPTNFQVVKIARYAMVVQEESNQSTGFSGRSRSSGFLNQLGKGAHGGSWVPEKKAEVLKMLQDTVKDQESKKEELGRLIEHTKNFVAARINSPKPLGIVVTMRQIRKFQAQKQHVEEAIDSLDALIVKVRESQSPFDVETKMHCILSVPLPECKKTNDELIEEARKLCDLSAVEHKETSSRAA